MSTRVSIIHMNKEVTNILLGTISLDNKSSAERKPKQGPSTERKPKQRQMCYPPFQNESQ